MAPNSELQSLRTDLNRLGTELHRAQTLLAALRTQHRELADRIEHMASQGPIVTPVPGPTECIIEVAIVPELDEQTTAPVHLRSSPAIPVAATEIFPQESRPRQITDLGQLETILGRQWLTWLGGLVLLLAVGFTVHWVWITFAIPAAFKVFGLHVLGLGLLTGAWYVARRGLPAIGEALAGVGLFTLYATALAAHRLYELYPTGVALVECCGISFLAIGLAVASSSRAMIVLGALGGFLAPHLASPPGGDSTGLFLYYAVLNAALTTTSIVRGWKFLNPLALTATVVMFGLWLGTELSDVASLAAGVRFSALALATLHATIFLLATTVPAWLRRSHSSFSDWITAAANSLLYMLFVWAVFAPHDDLRLDWLCGALAALHGGLFLLGDRWAGRDDRLARVHLAIGCALLTATIPLAMADFAYLGLAWCLETLLISAVAVRFADLQLRFTALLVALLAILRLAFHDHQLGHEAFLVAGVQVNVLTMAAGAVALMLAGLVEWIVPRRTEPDEIVAQSSTALAGILLAAGNVMLLLAPTCQWENRLVLAFWTVDVAIVWALGFRLNHVWTRIYAATLALGMVGTLALQLGDRIEGIAWPVVNARFASLALVTALYGCAGWAYRRAARRDAVRGLAGFEVWFDPALAVLAVLSLATALGTEIHAWYRDHAPAYQAGGSSYWMARQATFSIVGAIYAAALVTGGIVGRHRTYRLLGMLGLLSVVAKVLLVDLAELQWLPRILALAVLGVMLLAVSAFYQRLSRNGLGSNPDA
ncbi:MAG: DUF2339 domain-containing protein [Pirellulales bacterium]|nr:DUF2339 domain-containing protein [Pirellulales bacterium]